MTYLIGINLQGESYVPLTIVDTNNRTISNPAIRLPWQITISQYLTINDHFIYFYGNYSYSVLDDNAVEGFYFARL